MATQRGGLGTHNSLDSRSERLVLRSEGHPPKCSTTPAKTAFPCERVVELRQSPEYFPACECVSRCACVCGHDMCQQQAPQMGRLATTAASVCLLRAVLLLIQLSRRIAFTTMSGVVSGVAFLNGLFVTVTARQKAF